MWLKILYILTCILNSLTLPLPSYITPCKIGDDNCILKTAQDAYPYIIKGSKKYGYPSLNPLEIPKVSLSNDKSLKLVIFNIKLYNLDELTFRNISMTKNKISIGFNLPKCQGLGNYEMDGSILLISIKGNGKLNFTSLNPDFYLKADLEHHQHRNKTYIRLVNHSLKSVVGKVYFDFQNLFDGDPILGAQVNKFANENWRELLDEIREPLARTFSTIMAGYVNSFFSLIPFNELFLQEKNV